MSWQSLESVVLKVSELLYLYSPLFMYDYYSNRLPLIFNDFFKSINKVHQYQPRLASKISYYLPQARTNYGKFNIRFFGAKVLKRIAFLQLPSGSVMYFIFQFLHGHFPCLLLFVCARVCVNRKSCPQFYVNVGYLQIFSAWPSHLAQLA